MSVGTCGSCGGPVMPDGRGGYGCGCGASVIPLAFLAWGVTAAKPGPR